MERNDECLEPEDVAAFLSGDLVHRDGFVESHVARCADCRTLLSLAVRSDSVPPRPSPWATSVGSAAGPEGFGAEAIPGARVGRYMLGDRLGAGAMGVVFAAHDPELDRKVAVKVLRTDIGLDASRTPLRARLLREARAMAQLAHPNVVAVYDVGAFGEHVFIAMELVEGQTLAQWLAAERRPVREIVAMFIAAGRGLAAAHAAGLVHRDFKPENVLIGNDGRVRVTDFGVAHRTALAVDGLAVSTCIDDRGRSTTTAFAGTPFYMAPEQISCGSVDARTDQFSFCVAVYAALTGKHPFAAGDRIDVFSGQPRRDMLSASLWRVLRPGLALAREQRYPAMDALLTRLAKSPRRRRVAVAVAMAVTGLSLVAAFRGDTSDQRAACRGTDTLLSGTWDRERARVIGAAFRASGHGNAAAIYTAAARLLDQYAERWVNMRAEACAGANVRHVQSAAVWQLRAGCLAARLSELRALTDRLTTADAALVDRAIGAVQALGTLGVCADEGALQSRAHPDVVARPGAVAIGEPRDRASYFVTESDGALWQIRPDSDGATRERARVVEAVAGRPAIVGDTGHGLQVVTRRADGTLWHSWQDNPGGTWRALRLIDGVTDDPAAVLVDGVLVYFVRKTDGWLWRSWQSSARGDRWTTVRIADVATGTPGVGFDVAGDLYSITRKADGSLWAARHSAPTAAPDRVAKLVDNIASDPTFVRDAAGKMTYYARRMDGSLIAGFQSAAGSAIWFSVTLTNGIAGNPAVGFDADGKQICLARKTNGSLWSATQAAPAVGPWHEAALTEGVVDDPAVILDAEHRATYLVRKADGSLWQGRQDAPLGDTWHEHAVK